MHNNVFSCDIFANATGVDVRRVHQSVELGGLQLIHALLPLRWCSPGRLAFFFQAVPMSDSEQFSSLIGDIYDAALDPALWPDVLAVAARFVGGFSAALLFKDASRKDGNLYYDTGDIAPYYKQLYFDTYVKLDPSTTSHVLAEIGEPVATADIMPYDEFLE